MLNPYFNQHNARNEQLLIEDLIIETIQFGGVNILYLPRESVERDKIFGEDKFAKYSTNYQIEVYMENIEGFDGNSYIATQLGIQLDSITNFTMSKRRFAQLITLREKPLEGDLIYYPLSESLFEINKVSNKDPFFQLGQQYVYKLQCELFTYSHEEFDTNRKNIDRITDEHKTADLENADNSEIELEASEIIIDNESKDDIINEFDPNNPFGEF